MKARPARARIEFRLGAKERRSAANAAIRALALAVVVLPCERALSAFFFFFMVLLRREFLAPVGFTFSNFFVHH